MIARHGFSLSKLAEDNNVTLQFEAAVAGGIPAIKILREGLAGNRIETVAGILNGTCNYILSEMTTSKSTFSDVLKEAQHKGFAEADKKVELKAETSGRVISLPVKQGSIVKEGDPICSIFLAEKESFFKKAELEYRSAQKLFDEGLYSSNQFQNIKSNFETYNLDNYSLNF